ncbi:MAG: hypothetical protein J7M01_02735 [Candidatus Marinimicrobia bacterium]|nr:hypothetical protein [Candidatus Neomarinimicrobiota bacterium]
MSKIFKVNTFGIMLHACDEIEAKDIHDAANKLVFSETNFGAYYEPTDIEVCSEDDADFSITDENNETEFFTLIGV